MPEKRKTGRPLNRRSLSASQEDYLEAIYNLTEASGIARSGEVADALQVSRPSVTEALRALKKKGLINYRPYGYITFTGSGVKEAARVARKHSILRSFFSDVLGLQAHLAQKAACRAEHTLEPEVISRLLQFIEFVTKNGKDGSNFVDKFRQFCQISTRRKTKSDKIKKQ